MMKRPHQLRRGFNLIELLLALAISASLLTATMVALNASFMAYQSTTEVASTHTIGRLTMHRVLAMIRTGEEFGPFPTHPLDTVVESDFIEFRTPSGQVMSIEWFEDGVSEGVQDNSLYVILNPGEPDEARHLLLEGVIPQFDPDAPAERIRPFRLQFENGRDLYRATVDLAIVPDDNMSVALDGDNDDTIRLVGSAMPRRAAF